MSHAGAPKAPIDENVRIPDAVKRASANSDAVHARAYNTQPPAAAPAAEPPVVEPAPAPAPAPITEPAPARSEHVDNGSWEQRYWSLDGRYKQLSRDMTDMRELVATLQAPPAPAATAPAAENSFITDKDREEYGPELVDLITRAANGIADQKTSSMQKELKELREQVGATAEHVDADAQGRCNAELTRLVPDWETLNRNQEFITWASLPDVFSGAKRIELMTAAYDKRDANRVAAFFKAFKAEKATTATPSAQTPAPPAAPAVDLKDLAAPGRATSTSQPAVVDKPFISRAQISEFFRDVNRGAYNGREAEKLANEKMIFEAQKDGRITQ